MYGQGYGMRPQRPGVDLDERRQRRAGLDARMSPMPVTPRPEAPPQQQQEEPSALGQAITSLSGAYANRMMDNADVERGSMPGNPALPRSPAPSPDRTMLARTQPPIPEQAPPAGIIQPERPRMTRMPPQEAAPAQPAMPQAAPPAPTRPDPREIARQEAGTRGYGTDPIAQAEEQAAGKSKRGFWEALKTAGVGALQGLASGQGLGGALGGAIAGGAMSAISPELGGRFRFNTLQRPRMEQDMARQMQQEQFRRQQEQASLAGQKTAAEIQKLQAEAEAMPGREAGRQARETAQTEYYRERANTLKNPAPKPTKGDYVLEQGADGKMYRIDRQTGQAMPVEGFTPAPPARGGRGSGGGGGGGEEKLSSSALNLEAQAENNRIYAEELTTRLNSMQPNDPDYDLLKEDANEALRRYNDSVRKLGITHGARYETGAGRTPEGKPSPFMYYKRR